MATRRDLPGISGSIFSKQQVRGVQENFDRYKLIVRSLVEALEQPSLPPMEVAARIARAKKILGETEC